MGLSDSNNKPSDMPQWHVFAGFVKQHHISFLIFGALVTIWAGIQSMGISIAVDSTEYLPSNDPEVAFWLETNKRFGAMDVIMVGLEEPQQSFSTQGLSKLAAITEKLNNFRAEGILLARSITNVSSISEDESQTLNARLLIPEIPRTEGGRIDLKKRIQADTQIVGSLISPDMKGYMILIRMDNRRNISDIAELIRNTVEAERGNLNAYYFGAPFFISYPGRAIMGQLFWLIPLFGAVFFAILLVYLRRWKVIVFVIISTAFSMVWWLAALQFSTEIISSAAMSAALLMAVITVLVFARATERWLTAPSSPGAFDGTTTVQLLVAAVGLGFASLSDLPYLEAFCKSSAIGLITIIPFGVFFFNPLVRTVFAETSIDPAKGCKSNHSSLTPWLQGVAAISLIGLFITSNYLSFRVNPVDLFDDGGEVAQTLHYFNKHFGGSDHLQIYLKGDFTDPGTMRRLAALSDLLEGLPMFTDVRSISQILSFIAFNFGGVYRIPPTKESLDNLWFFLEGQPDIKPLITDDKKHVMIVARIPTPVAASTEQMLEAVRGDIDASRQSGPDLMKRRLLALSKRFGLELPEKKIKPVIDKATKLRESLPNTRPTEDALDDVRNFFESPEAPFTVTEEEWDILKDALSQPGDKRAHTVGEVLKACAGFVEFDYPPEVANQVAASLLKQLTTAQLTEHSSKLADQLFKVFQNKEIPEAFQTRAIGILTDLIDVNKTDSGELDIHITGMPALADHMSKISLHGLWVSVGWIWLVIVASALLITKQWRVGLRAGVESAITILGSLTAAWITGVDVDSSSAIFFAIPPLVSMLLSPWVVSAYSHLDQCPRRFANALLLAFAAAMLTLTFAHVSPISRVAVITACGIGIACLVSLISSLTRPFAKPAA